MAVFSVQEKMKKVGGAAPASSGDFADSKFLFRRFGDLGKHRGASSDTTTTTGGISCPKTAGANRPEEGNMA